MEHKNDKPSIGLGAKSRAPVPLRFRHYETTASNLIVTPEVCIEVLPRQQNLWVHFGSGSAPSV
jgi:hypothetical protein